MGRQLQRAWCKLRQTKVKKTKTAEASSAVFVFLI
jgi:hypothetical protein